MSICAPERGFKADITPACSNACSVLPAYLWRAAFSVSHATLDPDRACSAARDGTRSLSKAAIRL